MSSISPVLELDQLVELITKHAFMQGADILSTESYRHTRRGIVHRFLILEVRRMGMASSVWLRMDRRMDPKIGAVGFVLAARKLPAYDTVRRVFLPNLAPELKILN